MNRGQLQRSSMRSTWAVALGWLIGCGNVAASRSVDATQLDAPVDAAPACDPLAPFGLPQLVPGLDGPRLPDALADASLSPDERTIYFTGTAPAGDRDLYMATRTAPGLPFEHVSPLDKLNTAAFECCPAVSGDGLTILFRSQRISGAGGRIYVAARPSPIAVFGDPAVVDGIAATDTASDGNPTFVDDGRELWFSSDRSAMDTDIYRAVRSGSGYVNPAPVGELNSNVVDAQPTVSADRLTVYLASNRSVAGSKGGFDIYRAHRSTIQDGFGPPTPVTELNTTGNDSPRWLSTDGCRLYLHSDISGSSGSFHIYVATRQP